MRRRATAACGMRVGNEAGENIDGRQIGDARRGAAGRCCSFLQIDRHDDICNLRDRAIALGEARSSSRWTRARVNDAHELGVAPGKDEPISTSVGLAAAAIINCMP